MLGLVLSLALPAHPLPTLRYDRTVTVQPTSTGLFVSYTLEVNELSLLLDQSVAFTANEKRTIADAKPSARALPNLFAKKKLATLIDDISVTANGQRLLPRPQPPEFLPNGDHLEFRFRLEYSWPQSLDNPIQLHVFDGSYEGKSGQLSLTFVPGSGFDIRDLVEPGPLKSVPFFDLKLDDLPKLRTITATVTSNRTTPTSAVSTPTVESVATPPSLFDDLHSRGLTALFDSDAGTLVLMLAAAVFGMGHALTPGHGKTMVAAYLVGERGTPKHAVVLGITTTLAHTGSVIAVALFLAFWYRGGVPQDAQGWLQLAGGLLILVVGLWLFLQRIRGRADHVHLDLSRERFGWGRVILLGLGSGLIPCWDAVLLLLAAIASGRLAFALPVLVAFSLGLAAVLVALGLGVVYAHRAGTKRFSESRSFRWLPIVSAIVLVALGLWLARGGVRLLSPIADASGTKLHQPAAQARA